jgi:Methyltransferase FkbM domain
MAKRVLALHHPAAENTHMLKHKVVSAFANVGLSLGMPTKVETVEEVLRLFRPVASGRPLIRLGCDGDGGYLVPDDLEGIAAAFSPGVEDRASFESDLVDRGIECFLADASCSSAPIIHPLIHFIPKYLGIVTAGNTITLDDWVNEYAPGHDDLLLQMDIEGAEWTVLLNVSNTVLRRFRVVIIEFHNVARLLDSFAATFIHDVMARLTRDFSVVHIHPNNYGGAVSRGQVLVPRVLEVTFLRNDRIGDSGGDVGPYPHPLDQINNPNAPDIDLPKIWYRP